VPTEQEASPSSCLPGWFGEPMNDYARQEHHDFLGAAQQALADPPLQAALMRLTSTLLAGNRRGLRCPGRQRQAARPRQADQRTCAGFTWTNIWSSWKRRSRSWAVMSTGPPRQMDARRIVVEIAQKSRCQRLVKSKSMTTEEVHLNPALEAAGGMEAWRPILASS